MIYVPRIYQHDIEHFILNNERGNILARMGSGKTPASIAGIDMLRMWGECKRALVIAPKLVAESTWIEEIQKFRESFGHLSIAAAVGTPAQRKKAVMSKPDILCINYESAEWLIDGYGDDWPFDTIFSDESGRLKGLRLGVRTSVKGNEYIQGQGSKRAYALAKIAHRKVRRWYNLNGSPAPNGLVDTWGPQWFVDNGSSLGTSFGGFESKYFRTAKNADGYTIYEPLAWAQKAIEKAIAPSSIVIDPRPYLNVKGTFEHNIYVDLPPTARRAYDSMEKQLFADLEAGIEIEAFNNGSKSNKCLQLANGAVYYDTETKAWTETHDQKIEALKSVVSEANGEQVLVRYCFIPDKERILKAFPQFKPMTPENRALFKAGQLPGLVVHAASAGHGISLHEHCRVLCDYSSHFNLGEDEQIIERIGATRQAQANTGRDVYRYRLVARDTIEEHSVLPRLKYKMSVQESLLNALNHRKRA